MHEARTAVWTPPAWALGPNHAGRVRADAPSRQLDSDGAVPRTMGRRSRVVSLHCAVTPRARSTLGWVCQCPGRPPPPPNVREMSEQERRRLSGRSGRTQARSAQATCLGSHARCMKTTQLSPVQVPHVCKKEPGKKPETGGSPPVG